MSDPFETLRNVMRIRLAHIEARCKTSNNILERKSCQQRKDEILLIWQQFLLTPSKERWE